MNYLENVYLWQSLAVTFFIATVAAILFFVRSEKDHKKDHEKALQNEDLIKERDVLNQKNIDLTAKITQQVDQLNDLKKKVSLLEESIETFEIATEGYKVEIAKYESIIAANKEENIKLEIKLSESRAKAEELRKANSQLMKQVADDVTVNVTTDNVESLIDDIRPKSAKKNKRKNYPKNS